jgi:outer membrane protein TolC
MPNLILLATSGRALGRVTMLLVAGVLAPGCSSRLDALDREIAELTAGRTSRIGASTGPSSRAMPSSGDRSALSSTDLGTNNPERGSLAYSPADEARNVADRLQKYTDLALSAHGESALELDFAGALRTAQSSGREYLAREEDYIVAAISLLIERHEWSPRLFNDTSLGASGSGTQGRFENAWNVINTLRATQRLPFGGSVEAAWVTNATEQLRDQVSGRYVQSSELSLSANIPLLRGSGGVARESLLQAERDVIYAARSFERFRRTHLVSIATEYFRLLESQSQIVNQERQLASLKKFADGTAARVAAGRIREFESAIAENQLLSATASLASLREQYILSLDRFKVRLGLALDRPVAIKPFDLALPEPEIALDEAARRALEYRLDLQNSRDRLGDSARSVENARDALLPDLDLSGSVGIPTSSNVGVGGLGLDPEDLQYSAALTLSLPLDRRSEGLRLRQAMIALTQRQRGFEEERDAVVVEVRGSLRNVDLARFRLNLAERAVEINRRRLEEQQLKIDQIQPQQVIDTENELLSAENARDAAKTDLRVAVLNYLLATDQLRVSPDGTLERLPGMDTHVPATDSSSPR